MIFIKDIKEQNKTQDQFFHSIKTERISIAAA